VVSGLHADQPQGALFAGTARLFWGNLPRAVEHRRLWLRLFSLKISKLSRRTLFPYKMSLKGRSCWDVNIRINDAEELGLGAIGRFVAASEEIRFEPKIVASLTAGSSRF
jgi:hypothetical protein